MADRRIKIRSGEMEVWMEVTEEEYQSYYMIARSTEIRQTPVSGDLFNSGD